MAVEIKATLEDIRWPATISWPNNARARVSPAGNKEIQ